MSRGSKPQTDDGERFWQAVDRQGEQDCWPWLRAFSGGRDGQTYGVFTRSRRSPGRRNIYAHRMAYCLAHEIAPEMLPPETVIRHACDNPCCCNPAHLEAGTQADNAGDMAKRGRARRGQLATGAVLTEADVRAIVARLAAGEFHRVIAADFGVSRATVSQIAAGKNWAWLTRAAERVTVIQ